MVGKKLYIGYFSASYPHFEIKEITKETPKTIKAGYDTFKKCELDTLVRDGGMYGCYRVTSLEKGIVMQLIMDKYKELGDRLNEEIIKLFKEEG